MRWLEEILGLSCDFVLLWIVTPLLEDCFSSWFASICLTWAGLGNQKSAERKGSKRMIQRILIHCKNCLITTEEPLSSFPLPRQLHWGYLLQPPNDHCRYYCQKEQLQEEDEMYPETRSMVKTLQWENTNLIYMVREATFEIENIWDSLNKVFAACLECFVVRDCGAAQLALSHTCQEGQWASGSRCLNRSSSGRWNIHVCGGKTLE